MRNTYLPLIIALMIVIGCKQGANFTTDSNTDSSKSSSISNVGDLGYNGNTVATGGSWSKEYRNKFVQGCISKASQSVSATDAFSYCNCMAEKVEAKYPDQSQVDSSLTNADIQNMKSGCLTTTSTQNNNQSSNSNSLAWSASDQQTFMDNCVPGASKSLGNATATNYCSCMMQKLMAESPNAQQVDRVSKARMSELARDCIGGR